MEFVQIIGLFASFLMIIGEAGKGEDAEVGGLSGPLIPHSAELRQRHYRLEKQRFQQRHVWRPQRSRTLDMMEEYPLLFILPPFILFWVIWYLILHGLHWPDCRH